MGYGYFSRNREIVQVFILRGTDTFFGGRLPAKSISVFHTKYVYITDREACRGLIQQPFQYIQLPNPIVCFFGFIIAGQKELGIMIINRV